MKKIFLLLFLIVIFPQYVFADVIVFSLEQSEYYFKIGQEAIIPLKINNDYGQQITGVLQHTVTQQVNQRNVQFSNSNSNANSFTIDDGTQIVSLSLPTSNIPAMLVLNLIFSYDDGENKVVSLGPITIYFVSDETQIRNQSNSLQSSSQSSTSPQNSFPVLPQDQKIQQQLEDLLNNQNRLAQIPQQRLQNNQLDQDSSALKKQIENKLEGEKQIRKEFEASLSSNSDFMDNLNSLLQKGFSVSGVTLDPISNDTGSFNIEFQNSEGKWSTLLGEMNNGILTQIKTRSQEQQSQFLEDLEQNIQFQEFISQLTEDGYFKFDTVFQYNENKTSVLLQYENSEQDRAQITAIFVDDEVQSVNLQKNNPIRFDSSIISSAIVIAVATILYLIYKKRFRKKTIITKPDGMPQFNSYDYVVNAKRLISKAQMHYDDNDPKEAFAKASQAIRLFLRYDMQLKKEMTNDELLDYAQNHDYPINKIQECLSFASLVEFAKIQPDREKFDKMLITFQTLLQNKND